MKKENTKIYTPPTVDVVELTADNAIMQMSGDPNAGIPGLTNSDIVITF